MATVSERALLGVVVSGALLFSRRLPELSSARQRYAAVGHDQGTAGDQGLRSGENARLYR